MGYDAGIHAFMAAASGLFFQDCDKSEQRMTAMKIQMELQVMIYVRASSKYDISSWPASLLPA